MFAQRSRKGVICLVAVAIGITVVGGFGAQTAFARITANTIDPVAVVADNGRDVIVTGPISCPEGERAYLRVTVTQRSTGAVAEGRTFIACMESTQQWEVHASTQGKDTFVEGPATATAVARTAEREETTDAHQWLVDIALVGE
ncbi:MAG TPA: hypothetical protein VGX68_29950 [Thermoanaerobaculia bacterium]|jgi:hypothetical protein|nr:hypothetical protein [Thermoanaerobaculia bacterium]